VKFLQKVCKYQIIDNLGYANCAYYDGSVGLCTFDNCPHHIWAIRLVLYFATYGGLKIKLRGLMAQMPFVKVIAHE
jgi:prepilin-type processing-associated H-X9-DG protein